MAGETTAAGTEAGPLDRAPAARHTRQERQSMRDLQQLVSAPPETTKLTPGRKETRSSMKQAGAKEADADADGGAAGKAASAAAANKRPPTEEDDGKPAKLTRRSSRNQADVPAPEPPAAPAPELPAEPGSTKAKSKQQADAAALGPPAAPAHKPPAEPDSSSKSKGKKQETETPQPTPQSQALRLLLDSPVTTRRHRESQSAVAPCTTFLHSHADIGRTIAPAPAEQQAQSRKRHTTEENTGDDAMGQEADHAGIIVTRSKQADAKSSVVELPAPRTMTRRMQQQAAKEETLETPQLFVPPIRTVARSTRSNRTQDDSNLGMLAAAAAEAEAVQPVQDNKRRKGEHAFVVERALPPSDLREEWEAAVIGTVGGLIRLKKTVHGKGITDLQRQRLSQFLYGQRNKPVVLDQRKYSRALRKWVNEDPSAPVTVICLDLLPEVNDGPKGPLGAEFTWLRDYAEVGGEVPLAKRRPLLRKLFHSVLLCDRNEDAQNLVRSGPYSVIACDDGVKYGDGEMYQGYKRYWDGKWLLGVGI
eukprot:jgi/Chrzof1/13478/UNPLg00564.t1